MSFSISLLVGTYITEQPRVDEIVGCLEKNIANPFVGDIHLFVEDPVSQWEGWLREPVTKMKPWPSLEKLNELRSHPKVKLVPNGRRAFYSEYFEYATKTFPKGRVVVISNSDIEYDDTLGRLADYNLDNVFMCLTRDSGCEGNAGCFDTWIFTAPACPNLTHCRWPLGVNRGELKIAHEVKEARYCVINPCFSINAIHRHLATHVPKTWVRLPRIKGPYGEVHATGLEALRSKRRPK